MTSDQWRLVEELFHQIQEIPEAGRAEWLHGQTQDPQVRSELLAMLEAAGEPLEEVILGQMEQLMRRSNRRDIDSQIGTRVGPWRLKRVLGQGGMGSVFEAVRADGGFEQRAAIKIIKPGLVRESAFLERFKLERQILAKLEHPGIARLIDGGRTSDGVPYFVMEYVDGFHLLDYCDRHHLGIRERVTLGQQVCEAVGYAHRQGVIHRDLKPSNILVTAEGRPKLLDFGIAKMQEAGGDASDTALTLAGTRPYTPHYASPEQVRAETLTPASDVYSLGAILYELITGQRPHRITTLTQDAIERAVCEAEAVRPSLTLKHQTGGGSAIPVELDNIVLTALRKEPGKRFASAVELAQDLERFLDGKPVVARAEGTADRVLRRLRRNPAAWGVAAAALCIIAALSWMLLRQRQAADAPQDWDFQQLTSMPGEESHPSLLPDGSGVVYAGRGPGGKTNIFLLQAGQSRPENLSLAGCPANRECEDQQPALSPDGKSIAFHFEGGLYVMEKNGANRRLVAPDPAFDPAWSPDSRSLVYATEAIRTPELRAQQASLLFVTSPDGTSSPRRLNNVEDGVQPVWSPAGDRIAYWSTIAGRRDLFTIDTGGTAQPVRLTDDNFLEWSPAWSPDGRFLYFSSDRGGSMSLWRMPFVSGRALSPEPVGAPSGAYSGQIRFAGLSPNRFVYTQRSTTSTLYELPLTGPGGGSPRFLRERANNPDVSPDGRRVVYQDTSGKNEDLFVMSVDGQDSQRLTNDAHRDRHPRWSPDGRKVLFYSNRSGRYELWTIEPDSAGTPRLEQVTTTTGPSVLYGAWSPDGSTVLYNDLGPNPPYLLDLRLQPRPPARMLPYFEGGKSYSVTAWSKDGRWMAGFGRGIGLLAFEVAAQRIVPLAPSGRDPVWFPDNTTVAYTDGGRILTTNLKNGRLPRTLVDASPNEIGRQISLTPDGKKLYYTVVVNASDVWTGAAISKGSRQKQ